MNDPDFYTVVYECVVCHRGIVMKPGEYFGRFYIDLLTGLEYCAEHRPQPVLQDITANGGTQN